MKFKATIAGLLTAILATCIFTSYALISEAKKQTKLELAQAKGIIAVIETSEDARWMKTTDGKWEMAPYKVEYNSDEKYYEFVYESGANYLDAKGIIENIENN